MRGDPTVCCINVKLNVKCNITFSVELNEYIGLVRARAGLVRVTFSVELNEYIPCHR